MKGLDMLVADMIRREKINSKHAQSFLRGKAAKRFELTFDQLVSAMAALGHIEVCRLVKKATDESDYREKLRKAIAA